MKPRVVNLYAGPGTGKSTTCAALFAELKYGGHNVEMVTEFAKNATWERRGQKVFAAQEYIFGKQSFSLSKVASEVELVITDAPLLFSLVYGSNSSTIPSLNGLAKETYDQYDNLDIFLERNSTRAYNPHGRIHTENESKKLDQNILDMLDEQKIKYEKILFSRQAVADIMYLLVKRKWI